MKRFNTLKTLAYGLIGSFSILAARFAVSGCWPFRSYVPEAPNSLIKD